MKRDMTNELPRASLFMTPRELLLLDSLIGAYRPNHLLKLWPGEPCDLAKAHADACGDFDFVFLDATVSDDGSRTANELEQLLPYLDESAYLLVHHAAHHRVAMAIDYLLTVHPSELTDCGMVGRTAVWDVHHQAHYGGLRLLRYTRTRRLTVRAEVTA